MPPRRSAWRLAVGVSVALTGPSFGPLDTGVVAQRGYAGLGASGSAGGGETAMLMDEIAQLRAEVARLKTEPQVQQPPPGLGANARAGNVGGQLDMASVQRELSRALSVSWPEVVVASPVVPLLVLAAWAALVA